jgi:hypothetical protein
MKSIRFFKEGRAQIGRHHRHKQRHPRKNLLSDFTAAKARFNPGSNRAFAALFFIDKFNPKRGVTLLRIFFLINNAFDFVDPIGRMQALNMLCNIGRVVPHSFEVNQQIEVNRRAVRIALAV